MSIQAEQAILGAVMLSGAHILDTLLDSDFEHPPHRVIASALRDMVARGIRPDPIITAGELEARGKGSAGGPGGVYLFELTNGCPSAANAAFYATLVRKAARMRQAKVVTNSFLAALDRDGAVDEITALAETLTGDLGALPPDLDSDNDSHPPTVADLLAEEETGRHWLTPGFCERGDRVVLTGAEGMAKSTILKQVAICLSAGLNPWTGDRVSDGWRVLHIDAENSRRQSRRNYRWISNLASRRLMDKGWSERIVHYTRNDGLDLPGRDQAWFQSVCDRVRPDAIIIGPAYKLMSGDPNKEVDVLGLLRVLDRVRVKHDAALFVEAHSPHAMDGDRRTVRPYGASAWQRWPEIGVGVRRDMGALVPEQKIRPEYLEVRSFRGCREYRDWPTHIKFGGHSRLPWVPTADEWRPSVESDYQIEPMLGVAR